MKPVTCLASMLVVATLFAGPMAWGDSHVMHTTVPKPYYYNGLAYCARVSNTSTTTMTPAPATDLPRTSSAYYRVEPIR